MVSRNGKLILESRRSRDDRVFGEVVAKDKLDEKGKVAGRVKKMRRIIRKKGIKCN